MQEENKKVSSRSGAVALEDTKRVYAHYTVDNSKAAG